MPDRADEYYAVLSWSYGHNAVISLLLGKDLTPGPLYTCDAATGECDHLKEDEGQVMLPS